MAECQVTHDMLIGRATIDEWVENLGLDAPPSGKSLERIETYGRRLTALMQPGDELWEWRIGTEQFASTGGFAILRNGEIVWADSTWRS
jgi:hypothetical protein